MIRKAVIAVLLLQSLGTAFLMALSFSDGSTYSRYWVLTETRDTLVAAATIKGRLSASMCRWRLPETFRPPKQTSERLMVERRPIAPRTIRRMLVKGHCPLPQYPGRESHLTSIGLVVPDWRPSERIQGGSNVGYVYFPLWCPLIIFAAYPAFTFIRGPLRRHRRRKRGLCLHCG